MTVLHLLGGELRGWLMSVPLPAVRAIFVAVPALLLLWVLRLPAEAARPTPDTNGRWGEDLRVWACLALLLQAAIYLLL